jgi:hypothetical protein
MKTYSVRITYTGEIEAESKEELEEKLWVIHSLFDKPFNEYLFDAEEIEIEGDEEE